MADIPETAKKPQDHKAAKAEAIDPDEPYEFVDGEHVYVIDPAFRDDVEILEDLGDGKEISVVRRVLGAEQWAQWKDRNRGANGRVKATDAQPFLERLFEELGQGN